MQDANHIVLQLIMLFNNLLSAVVSKANEEFMRITIKYATNFSLISETSSKENELLFLSITGSPRRFYDFNLKQPVQTGDTEVDHD